MRAVWSRAATFTAAAGMMVAAGAGGAVAAGQITGHQIKDHSIHGVDVHKKTLAYANLTKHARKRLHGAQGPQGPAGATGPAGPAGPKGGSGLLATKVMSASFTVAPSASSAASVSCPAGWALLGGGVGQTPGIILGSPTPEVVSSAPLFTGLLPPVLQQGWHGKVRNTSATDAVTMVVYAVCGQLGS